MILGRREGFTLVEAMIVIAVIGIMSGLVAPSLLAAIPGMRVSSAARGILSDLRFARTLAVETGDQVVVDFDAPSSTHYRIYRDRDGVSGYTAPTDVLVQEVTLTNEFKGILLKSNVSGAPADGVSFDASGGNAVTFRPNGSAVASGPDSAVYLMPRADDGKGTTDRNRRVTVAAATGNARIESYEGSTWQ